MPPNDMGRATFMVPLADVKLSASGDPEAKGRWTMQGHAAVYNVLSHDMGGFRVKIAPTYFDDILASDPDVHLNREHDMRLLLGRTRNGSLELTQTDTGLRTWAMFPNTPLADETATLMSEGYLDQMSFATDIAESEWIEDQDGNITWHLLKGEALFDVTICAQGAFPQTDSRLAASLKDAGALLASAREAGLVAATGLGEADTGVAPEGEGTADVAELEAQGARDLAAFKARHKARFAQLTHPE